jgi:hypothetical protein
MRLLLSSVMVFAVACGVGVEGDSEQIEQTTEAEISELSSSKDTLLMVIGRDTRRCVSPLCGGYFVRDLNSSAPQTYVSGFDFSQSQLSEPDIERVYSAPGNELVLLGRLGTAESRFKTRPLIIKEAYLGLPQVAFSKRDSFYTVNAVRKVCNTTPCANLLATRVNRTTGHTAVTEVDVSRALKTLVSNDWVLSKVQIGRAVVAGRTVRSGAKMVLEASQVFIQLPERIQSCPRIAPPTCADGEISAWNHTENRCDVPAGCTPPGVCAQYIPSCDAGYVAVSWVNICPRWACEPEWTQ